MHDSQGSKASGRFRKINSDQDHKWMSVSLSALSLSQKVDMVSGIFYIFKIRNFTRIKLRIAFLKFLFSFCATVFVLQFLGLFSSSFTPIDHIFRFLDS